MARIAIAPEERKKLYVLGGLLAAIILVVVVLYVPRGGSKTAVPTPAAIGKTPVTGRPGVPPAVGIGPGAAPGGAPAADAGASGGNNISAASLVSVSNFRNDPFEPVPLPPPLPTPPPPPGPVEIQPPSIALEPPGSSGPYPGSIPPFGIQSGTSSTPSSRILTGLGPPRISRVADAPTAPSVIVLPGGGGESVSRSPNKRLSGVIIGDSVRALLEISDGENVTTRIVQPGDEVDGIRILRIERVSEGGRSVMRLFIRENGEERFVDLRPAPQQTTGEGGAAGPGRTVR